MSVDTTPVFSTNKCVFTLDGGKKRFIARWREIPSSNQYKEMPFALTETLVFADLVGEVGDDPNYVTREATAMPPKDSAKYEDLYTKRPRPGGVDYIGVLRKEGQEEPDTVVWLPIYFRYDFELDAQGYAVAKFPGLLRHGTFADVFHELDSTTELYQRVDLATTEKILRSEVARSKEMFEAFGMKFPVETTARWGILILLAVQLYFWLHLAEYRRRNIVDPSIAWIGTYDNALARSVFCITTLAAPTVVVCLVALKGNLSVTARLPNWLGAVVVTLLSLILSSITARTYFAKPAILESPDDD